MSRLLVTALVLLVLGCSRPAQEPAAEQTGGFPITVRDDLGRTVTVSRRPQRIISLAPSITETLFAIGAGPRVVAVTSTDTYPPEVKQLPTVGGFAPQTISLETILAHKPDLVLAGGRFQQSIVDAVEKLGVAALVIDPTSINGVEESIERLGRLTGQEEKSAALVADFRRRREAVRARTNRIEPADRPRVLYVLWDEPLQTAGPDTFVGQMIEEAGGRNLFADARQRYPTVSDESILSRNPDVILAPDHGGDALRDRLTRRPGWGGLAAVKSGRILTVPEDLLHRPGPRLIDGLERLVELLGGKKDKPGNSREPP
jgi:iron complex transport system substrate-binding protein